MFDFLFKKRPLLPLPFKRDLHCHIIPGVDDGSRDMTSSLSYLQSLKSFGVDEIVFTPHRKDVTYENSPTNIQPIFEQVVEEVSKNKIDLKLSYSFEYRLDEGFIALADGSKCGTSGCKLRPLFGRYLLIENSFAQPLQGLEQLIYQLQMDDFYLILAHPERYMYYAGHKGSHYEHLQDLQVDFQCNILSFAGGYGPVVKKMAYWLLEQGYVNFLGTDLHNAQHVKEIDAFLRSKEYERIRPVLVDSIRNDSLEDR